MQNARESACRTAGQSACRKVPTDAFSIRQENMSSRPHKVPYPFSHTCSNERCRVGRIRMVNVRRGEHSRRGGWVKEPRAIRDEGPRMLVIKKNGMGRPMARYLGPLPYCQPCITRLGPTRKREVAMENERRRRERLEGHRSCPRECAEGVLDAQAIITQVCCRWKAIISFVTL